MAPPPPAPTLTTRQRRLQVAGAALYVLAVIAVLHFLLDLFLPSALLPTWKNVAAQVLAEAPLIALFFWSGHEVAHGRGLTMAAVALILHGLLDVVRSMVALGFLPPWERDDSLPRLIPVLFAWGVACGALARVLTAGPRTPQSRGARDSVPGGESPPEPTADTR